MSVSAFDNNQIALLELLKASLFEVEPEFPENVDWDKVLDEAKSQTVVALAAKAVPGEYSVAWKQASLQSQARFMQILHAQTKLVQLLEQTGIPLVILKGTAAAMYYPEPMLRTMGDVDVLVPQDRFLEAKELMRENGYLLMHPEEPSQNIPRNVPLMKNGVKFELHHHFSSGKPNIEPTLIATMDKAHTHDFCGVTFPSLPETVNGLVLLTHVCQHLRDGMLGLRQVIDWMLYVKRYLDDEKWETEFRSLAVQYDLEKTAVTLTFLCQKWLGLSDRLTWCRTADEQTAKDLLQSVFYHGNFGRKAGSYRNVGKVSQDFKRMGFFKTLQINGLGTWDAAHKHAYLQPFAWIYQLCRWTKRGAWTVLNPTKLLHGISEGEKQSDLNNKLGL